MPKKEIDNAIDRIFITLRENDFTKNNNSEN